VALAQDVDAVRRFNRFYTRQIGVLQEKLLHSPFSLTEGRVLYEIGYHGENGAPRTTAPTAVDLARALDIDLGYLSRILQRFAKRRLITRTRSDSDRRQAHLALTARGQDALRPLQQLARDEVAVMLRPLAPAERGRIVDAMHLIQRSLVQRDNAAAEPFALREHRAGDMGWIVARHGALYAQEYQLDLRFEALVARIAADFIEHFDARREACWIAERDGSPLGCVCLVQARDEATRQPLPGIAQLRLLLVEPAARGLGLGSRLVAECTRFARDAGYRRIRLWTQSNLQAARAIYRREGYTLVASEPHRSFGHEQVAETWELPLS